MNRQYATIFLVAGIWIFLTVAVLSLPEFGTFPQKQAAIESVSTYYLQEGLAQTGALNIVSSVVWDYRGYDTLGEVTVLFTAVCGVAAALRRKP